jgi:hypothetical protein
MIDSVAPSTLTRVALPAHESSRAAQFVRHAALFAIIGFSVYLGIYVFAEQSMYAHTVRNRFFAVKTAPLARYDTVILGASHAAVFDYEDMNARLEELTNSHILNLSNVGAGVTPNRLMLDYALSKHEVTSVLYVVDSFIFYSPQWNEQRFNDTHLFDRAPFDPGLATLLAANPATRSELLDYVSGFSKINNQDRFKNDISDDEALRFNSTYRPIPQIDNQRLKYLYPDGVDDAAFARYLGQFEELLNMLEGRHVRVTIIKPPLPERVYRALPLETQFDERLSALLQRNGIAFFDFSLACNDERFFFNTDHLNQTGVLNFYQGCLLASLSTSAR